MLSFKRLTGNLFAKRAIEVAAAGGFKVAFVAQDQIAASVLAEAASTLGAGFVYVLTPCPCGNLGTQRSCRCTPEEIRDHQRKAPWRTALHEAEIWAIVSPPDAGELRTFLNGQEGESLPAVYRRVEVARRRYRENVEDIAQSLTANARELLLKAADQFQFSWADVCAALKVAEAIRALTGEEKVEAAHVAEAVEYRPGRLQGHLIIA